MKRFYLFLLFFSVFVAVESFAQEQLGMKLDSYAGFTRNYLNPGISGVNPYNWDVFIGGTHLTADNDYAYLENTNLIRILKSGFSNVEIIQSESGEEPLKQNQYLLKFNEKEGQKFGAVFTSVLGPAIQIRVADSHMIGAFVSYRVGATSQNIPASLTYEYYNAIPFNEPFQVEKTSVAAMSWREIGLHYSHTEVLDEEFSAGIGVNLKLNNGYDGVYLKSENSMLLEKIPDTTYIGQSAFEFGFTTNNGIEQPYTLKTSGTGLSIDLGFHVEQVYNDRSGWSAGISILDLGYIAFSGKVEKHRLPDEATFKIPNNFFNKKSLREIAGRISQETFGDSTSTFAGSRFVIWTPAALSAQWEYQFSNGFKINSIFIQRIPMPGATLKRNNLIALAPGFQSRWISLGIPLSIQNYKHFHTGFFIRAGIFQIGSDNLLSIIGKSELRGTDLYMGIKINPIQLNKKPKSRGPNVKCYRF